MSGYFPLLTVPDGTDFELLGDGPKGLDFLRWLLTPAGSETSARLRMQMQSSYGEFLAQSSGGHRSDNPHSEGASSSGSSPASGDAGALRPPFGAAKRELADAHGSLPPGPPRRRIGAHQADRDHGLQLQRDGHGDLVSLERLRDVPILWANWMLPACEDDRKALRKCRTWPTCRKVATGVCCNAAPAVPCLLGFTIGGGMVRRSW